MTDHNNTETKKDESSSSFVLRTEKFLSFVSRITDNTATDIVESDMPVSEETEIITSALLELSEPEPVADQDTTRDQTHDTKRVEEHSDIASLLPTKEFCEKTLANLCVMVHVSAFFFLNGGREAFLKNDLF